MTVMAADAFCMQATPLSTESGRQAVRRSPAALAGDTHCLAPCAGRGLRPFRVAKISWRVGALGAAYPTARRLTAILEISDASRKTACRANPYHRFCDDFSNGVIAINQMERSQYISIGLV